MTMMGKIGEQHLAPEVEAALDTQLAGWSARHALSEGRAEVIRQLALSVATAQYEALPYEWWERFFADLWSVVGRTADLERAVANGLIGS